MAEANPSIQINDELDSDIPYEEFELLPLISSSSISSWIELDKSKEKKKRVAGMRLKSSLAKRTSSQATIFLFGLSGVGKSTALNYLFDSNIIPTSRARSTTRKVTEYIYSIKSSQLGTGLKIGFIDTPGLGDTIGLDHENLVKVSYFIESHKELGKKIYPSIVLIFVSAGDNRIFEINSSFSKSLYILSELGVVDDSYPNAVIVVTHAMYLKNDYIEESKQIETNCKILARAHFSIEVPVVFIENLDKGKEMPQEGDWLILPDGTKQPLNLFEAMIHLMKQSGDEVGVEAVRLFFNESRENNVQVIGNIPKRSNNAKMTFWNKKIQEKLPFSMENQIYKILCQKVNSDDSIFLAFTYRLQKAGIVRIKQLQNASITSVKEKVFPFHFTDEELGWLFDIFDVKRINVKVDLRLLGFGYSREFNGLRSQVLDFCPMSTSKIQDNFLLLIPETCCAKKVGEFYIDDFQVIGETWRLFTRYSKLRFRIFYLLFQVNIADICAVSLNNQFIASLEESLPRIDPSNLEYKFHNIIFTNFLQKYGLHCVTGIYYGGFIEGELLLECKKGPTENKAYLIESKKELNSQLKAWIKCIRREGEFNPDVDDVALFHALSNSTLTWKGGDRRYYCNKLLEMTTVNWDNWIDSLEGNVVFLENLSNSVSLSNILLNSPSNDIRPYAEHFSIITPQDRPNLDALLALDSSGETVEPDPESGSTIYTRKDASDQSKSKCVVL